MSAAIAAACVLFHAACEQSLPFVSVRTSGCLSLSRLKAWEEGKEGENGEKRMREELERGRE